MEDNKDNNSKLVERYAEKVYKYRWPIIIGTILFIGALATGMKVLKMNTSYRVWFNEGSDEVVQYDKFRKRFAQDDTLIVAFTNEERSVYIKNLPSSVKFPDNINGRIKYDDSKKLLSWKGKMSAPEREQLKKLSFDKKYKSAIDTLYTRTSEKNLLNNTSVPVIQRLTKKFWKTKYVTRVDSLTNYSHTYVDGDDLQVKDLFQIKNPGHDTLREIFSTYMINEDVNNSTGIVTKKNNLIIDLFQSILPYSRDRIKKIFRSNISKEEMADLIAESLRLKLPVSRQELKSFISKYISKDKKVISSFIQKFYPMPEETKTYLKTFGIDNDKKAGELANKVIETRVNLKEVITPYITNKNIDKNSIIYRFKLWVLPHLSAIESPEQVAAEIRSFLDKLPPDKPELVEMIKPHISENRPMEILVEALQTKFPPYYDREKLKKWVSSKNLSENDLLDLTVETFNIMLPMTDREAKSFIKKYVAGEKSDEAVEELWPALFYTEDNFAEKLEITKKEKLIKDLLISDDGNTTQILITPKLPDNSQNKNIDFLKRIKNILLEEELISGYKYHVAGLPEMSAAFAMYIEKDLKLLMPLMFLLIILTILYLFKSVWGVVSSMLVVTFSITGTLGIMGFIGFEQNSVTSMIPNILMAVGIADSIHILTIFYRELHHGKNKKDAMITSLKLNMLPVFLTSLTTSVGFLSLIASVSPPIRILGVIISIGTIIAFLITVTFLPAVLTTFKYSTKSTHHKERNLKWSKGLGRFVTGYRNPILATFSVLLIISVFSITKIKVDNNPINYFDRGTYFRDAMDFVNEKLKGSFIMDISVNSVELPDKIDVKSFDRIIASITSKTDLAYLRTYYTKNSDSKVYRLKDEISGEERVNILGVLTKNDIKYKLPNKPDGIKDPGFLRDVEKFQKFAETKKELKIVHSSSLVDIIKTVNQRLNKNRPEFYRIPDDRKMIAENLFLYTNSVAFGRDLNNQINVDQSAIRITLRKKNTSSEESIQIISKLQDYIDKNMKEYDIQITGRAAIFTYMGPKVTKNMILGLVIALCVITIILIITFRSLSMGLLSIIPNVLPLLMMFGLIGLSGVYLNMGMSMVAMVALGIVVDDTIHFIAKYMRSRKAGKSVTGSIYQTYHDVGSAIIFTSVILTIGFGIFIFSNFVFGIRFGTFTSFTMVAALFLDLLLLPAILLLSIKNNETETDELDKSLAYEKT